MQSEPLCFAASAPCLCQGIDALSILYWFFAYANSIQACHHMVVLNSNSDSTGEHARPQHTLDGVAVCVAVKNGQNACMLMHDACMLMHDAC